LSVDGGTSEEAEGGLVALFVIVVGEDDLGSMSKRKTLYIWHGVVD
jgi:hypothetical protein